LEGALEGGQEQQEQPAPCSGCTETTSLVAAHSGQRRARAKALSWRANVVREWPHAGHRTVTLAGNLTDLDVDIQTSSQSATRCGHVVW
jgi:hypothetical protein